MNLKSIGKSKIMQTAMCVLMAGVLLIVPVSGISSNHLSTAVQAATTLSDLQAKQQQLQKEQADTKAKLESLKDDKSKQLDYKATLDTQMTNVQSQVDGINAQINTLDAQISEKQTEIDDKQKSINDNFTILKQRLYAIYLVGNPTTLESLMSAKNVNELMDNLEVAQSVTAQDKALIENLKSEMATIAEQQTEIQSNKDQVSAAKTALDTKKAELQTLENQSAQAVAALSGNISGANAKVAQLNTEIGENAQETQDWMNQYYASQKSSATSTPVAPAPSSAGFMWPAPGTTLIFSKFNDADHNYKHDGIDIAGSGCSGKPVVAAAAGRVIAAGFNAPGFNNYGNCVAIDHGNGFITFYAHMSAINVSVGQTVTQGQRVGSIGSTGRSTGPHLHFGMHYNGAQVDPQKYL